MLEIIGAVFKILSMLLVRWFQFTDEKKEEAREILKQVKDSNDPSSITKILDSINRL